MFSSNRELKVILYSTFIKKNAKLLQDTRVTSKIIERPDIIIIKKKKIRSVETAQNSTDDEHKRQIEALAFAGLVFHMKACRAEVNDTPSWIQYTEAYKNVHTDGANISKHASYLM